MFKTMFIFLFFLAIIYMNYSNNPMMMGFLIILQAILISLMISFSSKITWFSLLIFLIYLGGILMLFCYIISLMNKIEPMKKSKNNIMFFLVLLTYLSLNESWIKITIEINLTSNISSLYSYSMTMPIFLMIFLLLIMIFVVFISESPKTSMRVL